MIDQQKKIRLIMELRRCGVIDTAVLGAIETIPREQFIPDTFQDQAYENIALPIGHGQTISQPLVVGLMTQALDVNDRHKVLEIGTGSGYQAAVLARLCRRLYSIERIASLSKRAEEQLQRLRIRNYTLKVADGSQGWSRQAPFERMIATAAARHRPPQALLDQLAPGGILVCPVAQRQTGQQMMMRYHKQDDGTVTAEDLWPVRFVPLVFDDDVALQSFSPDDGASDDRAGVIQERTA